MKSGSSFLYLQYPLKMNRTDLKDASGISFNVLAKMGKNEFVSMESLMKICATLNCNIGGIVDFLPESEVEFHTHWDGVYRTLGHPLSQTLGQSVTAPSELSFGAFLLEERRTTAYGQRRLFHGSPGRTPY